MTGIWVHVIVFIILADVSYESLMKFSTLSRLAFREHDESISFRALKRTALASETSGNDSETSREQNNYAHYRVPRTPTSGQGAGESNAALAPKGFGLRFS